MVISSIRHIGIVVKDLNRSLKFYSDLLELKTDTNLAVDATLSFTLGQSEEDDV